MSIQRHYRCSDCGESFWVTLESKKAPPPECPHCDGTGQKSESALIWLSKAKREADARIRSMVADGRGAGIPNAASAYAKSSEQVYRAMEAGSQFRAEAAASQLGVPVAEMSNLKITDMHDRPKAGEVSAKIPMSNEGRQMEGMARQMSFNAASQAQGAEYAKATQVGPAAGKHGSNMASLLSQNHASVEAGVRSRGRMG